MNHEDCNLKSQKADNTIDLGRREALQKIAVGVGVVAGASILPESWTRPIIGQIVLPAHAATSGSSLHDPCAVELRSGDSKSASVVVKVTGFVTPPTGNLPVTITATSVGGAGLKAEAKSTTDANGNFEAFLTIGGGPGITSVNVTTVVAGADGAANCVVHTTSATSSSSGNSCPANAPVGSWQPSPSYDSGRFGGSDVLALSAPNAVNDRGNTSGSWSFDGTTLTVIINWVDGSDSGTDTYTGQLSSSCNGWSGSAVTAVNEGPTISGTFSTSKL